MVIKNDNDYQKRQAETLAMANNPWHYLSDKEKAAFTATKQKMETWISLIFGLSEKEFVKKRREKGASNAALGQKGEIISKISKQTVTYSCQSSRLNPNKHQNKSLYLEKVKPIEILARAIYLTPDGKRIVISELNRYPTMEEQEEHRSSLCNYEYSCSKKAKIFGFISFSCINCPMRLGRRCEETDKLDICEIAGL